MPRGTNLTLAEQYAIKAMHRDNFTTTAIAKELGRTWRLVQKYLDSLNIQPEENVESEPAKEVVPLVLNTVAEIYPDAEETSSSQNENSPKPYNLIKHGNATIMSTGASQRIDDRRSRKKPHQRVDCIFFINPRDSD